MDSYNLTHTGAELDSAVGRALEGFAAADAATKAANDAAKLAEDTAAEVQKKLDNGEFIGPIGKSGVYVGGGDMPEGYTVQVDPTGDMLCYTAGESDSRYANVLTGTASGPVAALEDVSPTGALRRAAVLGATTETGEGDKGPDNPYTLAGVQPTKVTVCGRNMIGNWMQGMISTEDGNTITSNAYWVYAQDFIPISGNEIVSVDAVCKAIIYFYDSGKGYVGKTQPFMSANLSYGLANYADYGRAKYVRIAYNFNGAQETITPDEMGVKHYVQLEKGTAATPYEPYTGQTVSLPTIAPLWGTGDIRDEYDAATGVETRRWKQVVFDGTEKWNKWREDVCIYSLIRPALVAHQGACNAYPIFKSINWNAFPDRQFSIETKQINFRNDACADVDSWKAYLAAQYAAGTPVTVLYQLAEPVVTRHDPARILPPAPVCRIFADAGNVDVGYNRDVNIVIPKLEAALAELLGGGAQPME